MSIILTEEKKELEKYCFSDAAKFPEYSEILIWLEDVGNR